MGKHSKYSHGYPTQWSHWMYPPKNVSTMQYIATALKGQWKAYQGTYRANWQILPVTAFVLWGAWKISVAGADSPFSVSIRSEKGNWLYGPPDPRAVHHRHEEHILTAPDK
uniref:Uncharacterized LOC100186633 n=1 Tax=Ciona intestinalis TaxID=7719 RepID=H2Y3J3_CIOIN|nr:uncharacterized protein LOC100186633 [Ciona intestinalis]|eukprot:XP_002126162.1 uncharacterized protein LOC100186633 [Ciona intestinalis]